MDFFYYLIGGTVFIIFLVLIRRYFLFKDFFFTSKYEDEFIIKKDGDINSLILNALRKSNFFRISDKNDFFSCYTKPSIWSWSEKIIIRYKRTNESTYHIFFSSICFFPLQIIDWGKNERNYNLFCRNILNAL